MSEQKPQYKHELVKVLAKLHEEWHEELSKGQGVQAIVYKSMSKEIPVFLAELDDNQNLLEKISVLVVELAGAVVKDSG